MRLLHADADGTPGLAVDRYGDVAIIYSHTQPLLEEWIEDLHNVLANVCTSAYTKVRPRGGKPIAPAEPAWGPPREELSVAEDGIRYLVRPAAGLTVGLFLDMRDVRLWLHLESRKKTVLNVFAYTCSLGLSAALGGAKRVVNLDVSRPYLEWGKANYAMNDAAVDERDFIYGDAFDWLQRFARRQQRFDLVIVDPPSFSSTPFSVTRDYARLVSAAARVVSSGGVLLAATNHAATSERHFEAWLTDGLAQARRRGSIALAWHEPDDFPIPRGREPYLKVRAVELD